MRAVSPGWFAAIMAVGIVSQAAGEASRPILSDALLWIAVAALITVAALLCARIAIEPMFVRSVLADPLRCSTGFAIVAALAVIGLRLSGTGFTYRVQTALLLVCLTLWVGIGTATVGAARAHRRLIGIVTGNWLLAVVATQSLSLLVTAVAQDFAAPAAVLIALALWATGLLLYLPIAAMALHSLAARGSGLRDFSGDYWILMGAIAISALAGTRLSLSPFAPTGLAWLSRAGAVLWVLASAVYVVVATLWFQRWTRHRVSRRFDATWWSMVFPLGMYAVSTFALADLFDLEYLRAAAQATFWVSVAALALTVGALVKTETTIIRFQGWRALVLTARVMQQR